jgi:lipopolysaccharide biosynthesis glycosyltransferase
MKANNESNILRLIPSVFTFDSFDLCKKYDQVLYLDSDMLVISNIMDIFSKKPGIYVTPALFDYEPNIRHGEFNGGFLFLNKMGGNKIKNELIDTGLKMDDISLFDQPILNKTLENRTIYLSCDYNAGKRMFSDLKINKVTNDLKNNIKIIHYVGAKPWDHIKSGSETDYNFIEKMWVDYFSKITYKYAKV